jgi:hypothetical protein
MAAAAAAVSRSIARPIHERTQTMVARAVAAARAAPGGEGEGEAAAAAAAAAAAEALATLRRKSSELIDRSRGEVPVGPTNGAKRQLPTTSSERAAMRGRRPSATPSCVACARPMMVN